MVGNSQGKDSDGKTAEFDPSEVWSEKLFFGAFRESREVILGAHVVGGHLDARKAREAFPGAEPLPRRATSS